MPLAGSPPIVCAWSCKRVQSLRRCDRSDIVSSSPTIRGRIFPLPGFGSVIGLTSSSADCQSVVLDAAFPRNDKQARSPSSRRMTACYRARSPRKSRGSTSISTWRGCVSAPRSPRSNPTSNACRWATGAWSGHWFDALRWPEAAGAAPAGACGWSFGIDVSNLHREAPHDLMRLAGWKAILNLWPSSPKTKI